MNPRHELPILPQDSCKPIWNGRCGRLRVRRTCSVRQFVTAGAFLLCTAVVLGQQDSRRSTQGTPAATFKSAIEAVQMDVFVTDAAGAPVSGLTAGDFELFEDGAVQPITTFQAIDIPFDGSQTVRLDQVESDVLANGPSGRAYVFAIDDLDGCAALRTRLFLRQFLETFLGPRDVAAIAHVGKGLTTSGQDFTGSRRLLLKAIEKIGGVGSLCSDPRRPGSIRTTGRIQQMGSLRDLIESVAKIPGRHKAMLFFTHGPEIDMLDIVDYNGGVLGLAGEDAHAAMAAATRTNLRVYPIDPAGLSPDYVPLETAAAYRSLGAITGGFALVNSNSFTQTFERIVRENSTYYMLGFNSAYERDDGKYVRVQVRIKRPGLTVHAREGYVAPTRDERRAKALVSVSTSPMEAALGNPLTAGELDLRVTAVAARSAGTTSRVTLTMEMDAESLGLIQKNNGYTGEFELRYLATDARLNVYPEVRHKASVRVEPKSGSARIPLDGIRVRVLGALELPAGRYQVRVAAGASGRTGNVVYDLEVPDFNEAPLTMSGVSLRTPKETNVLTFRSGGPQGKPILCRKAPCIAPLSLQTATTEGSTWSGAPTTVREFGASQEVVLATEIYHNAPRRPGDPPRLITLTTELRGSSGEVIPLTSDTRPVSAAQGANAFSVRLRMEDVGEGDYVLHVEARLGDDAAPAVSREIPIRVR